MSQKVAIISGGSGGIGKTIAKAYAQLGINVVLLARNEERLKDAVKEIDFEGGTSKYIIADVTNTYTLQNAVKEVYEMYGHIDIIVNCNIFCKPMIIKCLENISFASLLFWFHYYVHFYSQPN